MLKIKMLKCLTFILIFFGGLFVIGCGGAHMELISKNISNVEVLINQVRQDQADKFAPLDLKLAEENLQEAKDAFKDDEPEKAQQKVELAGEYARSADAKTRAAKAKKQTDNELENLELLRNEIDRAHKVK